MYNSNKRLCNYTKICVWYLACTLQNKKYCYFSSHLIHTSLSIVSLYYTCILKWFVYWKIFHTNYCLLHVLLLHTHVFPSLQNILHQQHLLHHHTSSHIIVIVINNFMRPYGTQLSTYSYVSHTHTHVLHRKMLNRKKIFFFYKIYELR